MTVAGDGNDLWGKKERSVAAAFLLLAAASSYSTLWGCVEMNWSCLGWVLELLGGDDQGEESGGICSLSFSQVSSSNSTSNHVSFLIIKVFFLLCEFFWLSGFSFMQ